MKLASVALLLVLCVLVDAIVDFVPSDQTTPKQSKDSKKTTKDDEAVENDDQSTHADPPKTVKSTVDKLEGLKPLTKTKRTSASETQKIKEVENDSADNPDKVSQSEARMDHAEDMNQENAYGEVDPELNKDYGEEEDNSYDSVLGYQNTDVDPVEDEANSINDVDLNNDDVNNIGTGR